MMFQTRTAEQIRQIEAPLLARDTPLMSRAARALAHQIEALRFASGPSAGRVAVLAGAGNNGGDGLFAAAYLAARGVPVRVVLTQPGVHPAGLAAVRAQGIAVAVIPVSSDDQPDQPRVSRESVATSTGAESETVTPDVSTTSWESVDEDLRTADIWVDALVGIGARGGLRGQPAVLVERLVAMRGRQQVVAVDIPSGLIADSSEVPGPVLRADHTISFIAAKAATFLPPAALEAGRVSVVSLGVELDTGLPGTVDESSNRAAASTGGIARLEHEDVLAALPAPGVDDHKYTRGMVAVYAGDAHYPGAGVLCAGGALRCGAGMVRHLAASVAAVQARWPEVVDGVPDEVLNRVNALVVGPGCGDEEQIDQVLRRFHGTDIPIVVDAGALPVIARLIAEEPQWAPGAPGRPLLLLTPHAGELARLRTGEGTVAAAALATELDVVVLLKGAVTVIATPGALSYSQADGNGWLATAGSGDVLAGVLGTVIAQRRPKSLVELAHAAALGAHLHGVAGVHAAASSASAPSTAAAPGCDPINVDTTHAASGVPILAQDLIAALPAVLAR